MMALITIDRHTLALISIIGTSFDLLGAMYLAYDLLGGEHGPLRTLTRGVTYGAIFGAGYGLFLGPVFGLAAGLAHGITLAIEFSRASQHKPKASFWTDAAMSAIRGAGFAVGATYLYGIVFGALFGGFSTVGQILAYRVGMRPTLDYQPATRPRMTRHQFLGAINRTVGYTAAGYICAIVAGEHATSAAIGTGIRTGAALGIVTAVSVSFTPWVEWTADHVPEKRMGVYGIGMILIGFLLQSLQYWVVLLDVTVN